MMKRKEFSGRLLEVHNLSSNVPCILALPATEIHPLITPEYEKQLLCLSLQPEVLVSENQSVIRLSAEVKYHHLEGSGSESAV